MKKSPCFWTHVLLRLSMMVYALTSQPGGGSSGEDGDLGSEG